MRFIGGIFHLLVIPGFSHKTVLGKIVSGPMDYTLVPDATPMVMSTLQSEGGIRDYYQVGFNEKYQTM